MPDVEMEVGLGRPQQWGLSGKKSSIPGPSGSCTAKTVRTISSSGPRPWGTSPSNWPASTTTFDPAKSGCIVPVSPGAAGRSPGIPPGRAADQPPPAAKKRGGDPCPGLVDPEGRGHLFVGQSGAGKSTMARFWAGREGVRILSDDRIILRQIRGEIWMYGTPWHGEARHALPEKARLAGYIFCNRVRKTNWSRCPRRRRSPASSPAVFRPFTAGRRLTLP